MGDLFFGEFDLVSDAYFYISIKNKLMKGLSLRDVYGVSDVCVLGEGKEMDLVFYNTGGNGSPAVI